MKNYTFKDTLAVLPASAGIDWIVRSWQLLKTHPLKITIGMFIYLGINILLIVVPILGHIASFFLLPALCGGLLYFLAALDRNEDPSYWTLFKCINGRFIGVAFQILVLAIAGGVLLAMGALYLVSLVSVGLGGWSTFTIGMVCLSIAYVGVFCLFWLAVPIMVFNDTITLKESLKLAFNAARFNILPLGLNALICTILLSIGSCIIIGGLIMLPICFICLFYAYKDILVDE